MKKIFAILFAVVISISAISIGILPVSARIVDRQFVVDEVVENYERYILPSNSESSVDVSGQYLIDFRSYSGTSALALGQEYVVYSAPVGYYILAQTDRSVEQYLKVDRIAFKKNQSNVGAIYYLDGEAIEYGYSHSLGKVIMPYLPSVPNDAVGDMFVASSGFLNPVVKFGNGNPTPAFPIPDQSLPCIFQVWQSVTGWIADGLSSVAGVFYAAGQLTLIGTLAVISVGIALIFLLIAFIRKFLFLRG